MKDLLLVLSTNYHWQAAALALTCIVLISILGKALAFQVPALRRMREINHAGDKAKLAKAKYPPLIKAGRRLGATLNLVFFILILPFCVSFEARSPLWILLETVLVLMVYDFFYYLCHRFWFHGKGWMRQIHAIHHQARSPTHIDAYYVHPLETFIGLSLYIGTVALLALAMGPFHVVTIVTSYLVFYLLNIINHTFVDLPYFPFRTLTWITAKHHVHHENMHKGNYATITMLYDKLFGTLD